MNQSHSEIFPHICLAIINQTRNLRRCAEMGTLGPVDENVNWRNHYEKLYGGFKKLKIELRYDPTIPFLGISLKVVKTVT